MNILVLCSTDEGLAVAYNLASSGGVVKLFCTQSFELNGSVIPIKSWRHELSFPDFVVTDSPTLGQKYLRAARDFAVPLLAIDNGVEREHLRALADTSSIQEIRTLLSSKKKRPWWRRWKEARKNLPEWKADNSRYESQEVGTEG